VGPQHVPVLLEEALEALAVRPGGFYVDGTLGLAGHARAILERSAPGGRLLATDRDAETLAQAREALQPFGDRVRACHADFRELPALLAGERPDGILLDLGVSSAQLDDAGRGFSFRTDGPLDMRLDRSQGAPASEAVNRLPETVLADIVHALGEEPRARRVAREIVEARRRAPIRTTGELAAIVRRVARGRAGLDAATRTFQALRIHVNRELEGLGTALEALAQALAGGGRLVVISFHSLEDREAKTSFRALASRGFRVLTRKPLRPGASELGRNPRARSARLRAIERPRAEAA
jgi:16S rRNA (cytosine1402-N4)-methyltransferase